jgi:predicted nucleotidyltransferase
VQNATLDFFEILQTLKRHKVDFIIVGGVCAVLHGAPVSTFDLDIVHSRSEDNLTRLKEALEDLDAYYRTRRDKRLIPDITHLASPGHQLLMTRFGPLDLLGAIGDGKSYEDLIEQTSKESLENMSVYLLNLETLINIKEKIGREKDNAVLPVLRSTLEEKKKREQS